MLPDVDQPGECCKEEEADSAAEKRPGRRPDPLYDRADSGEVKQ
jgi:hypothetical protein